MTFFAKLNWVLCINSLWGQDLKCWHPICFAGTTRESTGLISRGSGSSSGSVGPHQCDPCTVTCTLQSLAYLPLLEVAALQWCFQRWLGLHSLWSVSAKHSCLLQPLCKREILLLSWICWLKQSISLLPFHHYLESQDVPALPAGHSCHFTHWYHQGAACSSPEAKLQEQPPTLHPSVGKEVQQRWWLIEQSL